MARRKFGPGDWAKIKYGEYAGCVAKVSMLEKNGSYVVIPYGRDGEPKELINLNARAMDVLAPLILNDDEFQSLLRGETFYSDYMMNVFPAFNIRPKNPYTLTASDIKKAIMNINKQNNMIPLFKEWFWLIINVFYQYLNIEGRYNEEIFSDGPETEDEIFSTVYGLCEKIYWKLEEQLSQREDVERFIIKFQEKVDWGIEKSLEYVDREAYKNICDDIVGRVTAFEMNIGKPMDRWVYADTAKLHVITSVGEENSLNDLDDDAANVYKRFVKDLYMKGEPQAISTLAWGHYEGNRVFDQDWVLAERYMLELFNKNGDPYAANALGYIYYYGRTNAGMGEYEKAFEYFSYGALAELDESIYMVSDMLIKGLGTKKNKDMGLTILLDGYKRNLENFCDGQFTNKLADYAYRMGNASRDELFYGMGVRDAYKFYLEAKFAIRKRREEKEFYGDDVVERHIDHEIAHILDSFNLDVNKDTLKCDFPIYINQLFEDKFPIRITITTENDGRSGKLLMERFRPGSEMVPEFVMEESDLFAKMFNTTKILVSFPELSYVEMISSLEFGLENITALKRPDNGNAFLCDGFRRNETTNSLEFYARGELLAAIDAEWYVLKVDKSDFKLL